MLKEERDVLRAKADEFDMRNKRIVAAVDLMRSISANEWECMEQLHIFVRDRIDCHERQLFANAIAPILSNLMESDIQKINDLSASIQKGDIENAKQRREQIR